MTQDPDRQEQIARPRLFYGWVIVAVAALTEAVSTGAGSISFGVLLRPMSEGLGWSRTVVTAAASFQMVANLFVSPAVGIIVDRWGPRLLMVAGASVATIAYLLLSRISEPWQFYLLYVIAAAFGLNEMGSLVTSSVVSKWFVRLRGRALALSAMGFDVGNVVMTPATAFVVTRTGWRSTWSLLGVLVAVTTIVPAALFMRRAPEDMGLRPDGGPKLTTESTENTEKNRKISAASVSSVVNTAGERAFTVREAVRTRAFWLILLSTNLASMGASALVYHLVAYLVDSGFSLEAASLVVVLQRVFAMGSKLMYGFLSERVPVRFCLAGNYLARALGFAILLVGQGPARAYVFAVVAGLLSNSFGPLQAQLWADYYGRRSVGAIRGFAMPFSLIASAGGPLLAALVYDRLGSYDAAFATVAVLLVVGAVTVALTRAPVQP